MLGNLLDTITENWGWTGLNPVSIKATNEFCNVIVEDVHGEIWRIVPEDLSCERIANNASQFAALMEDPDFRQDWEMANLVALSRERWGVPSAGQGFQLVIPSVLGGAYVAENVCISRADQILSLAGEIAQQVKALPDGMKVNLKVTD